MSRYIQCPTCKGLGEVAVVVDGECKCEVCPMCKGGLYVEIADPPGKEITKGQAMND